MHGGIFFHAVHVTLNPTSCIKSSFVFEGFVLLQIDARMAKKITTLCHKTKLKPPSKFMRDRCQHYGLFVSGHLMSYLCLSSYNLNNKPGSIRVNRFKILAHCSRSRLLSGRRPTKVADFLFRSISVGVYSVCLSVCLHNNSTFLL